MLRRLFGHKRLLLGIGAGGIFVAGLLAGMIANGGIPAFAAGSPGASTPTTSTSGNKYCQTYLSTLASELHISQQQLAQDNQAAIEKALDQMQADGKISAAQNAQIEQTLQNASQHPCALLGHGLRVGRGRGGLGGLGGHVGAQLQGAHQQIEAAVAPTLKLSAAALDSDLNAGQTIAHIAKTQGAILSTVNTAYENAVRAALKTAVGNGTLTQAQSTALFAKIQQAVSAGHYPLLERPARSGGMPLAPAQRL